MKEIVYLVLLWFITWGFFNIYYKWKIITKSLFGYVSTSAYFLINFLIIFVIYKKSLLPFTLDLVVALLIATTIAFLLLSTSFFRSKIENGKYFLIFHVFNILYQQGMVVLLINQLSRYFGSNYKDYYFAVTFMLLHTPVVFLRWAKLRYYYLLLTYISGYLFSFFINNIQFGAGLSYLAHYIAYIFIILILKDKNKI